VVSIVMDGGLIVASRAGDRGCYDDSDNAWAADQRPVVVVAGTVNPSSSAGHGR
jgi:hypothetical protein